MGGNLNGSLNLGGSLYLRQQCRPMIIRTVISRLALYDNKESDKPPCTWWTVDSLGLERGG